MPARMTDDHHTLMRQLDEIAVWSRSLLAVLESGRLDELAAELRQRVTDMCDSMRDHLSEEERVIPAILRDHFH